MCGLSIRVSTFSAPLTTTAKSLFARMLPGLVVVTLVTACDRASESQQQRSSAKAHPIRLASRTFTPPVGVDPALLEAARAARAKGAATYHCIAQFSDMVPPERWQPWNKQGIVFAAYLGELNWVVRVPLEKGVDAGLRRVRDTLGAAALTTFQAADRVPSALNTLVRAPKTTRPIRVVALFYPTADMKTASGLIQGADKSEGSVKEVSSQAWSFGLTAGDPLSIRAFDNLLAYDGLQFTSEELPDKLPLMDVTRARIGAEGVQHIVPPLAPLPVYGGYTGRGVHLANGEGLDPNHDDFWNHDPAGNRTTPRFPANSGGDGHGTMTAGIMLGNGWRSAANGGTAWQWRGVAPEAIFVLPGYLDDAENRSYFHDSVSHAYMTESQQTDKGIAGLDFLFPGHPVSWAVGNQGWDIEYTNEEGYYSILATAKNAIGVARVYKGDLTWAGSSLGPTFDGRLKPDISAPAENRFWPPDRTQPESFAIDEIEVRRADNTLVQHWDFNSTGSGWAGGWGQPFAPPNPPLPPPVPSAYFTLQEMVAPVVQVPDSSGLATGHALGTALTPPPWNQWDASPSIGTGTQSDGVTPLAIAAQPGDVVKLKYRLGPEPLWQNAHPSLGFQSQVDYIANKYVAFSAPVPATANVADGAWHSVTIPVGMNADWQGTIRFLDVRLRDFGLGMVTTFYDANNAQSQPSGAYFGGAGGSSAAAPVVTGAIALLLEQMNTRFGCVLSDHYTPSPFRNPPGLGVPLPSIFKAILLHTADDLASTPHVTDQKNPDTGVLTAYYKGPDLATGYGDVNIGEAIRLVEAEAQLPGSQYIHEGVFASLSQDTYQLFVPPGQTDPLRVTLVWDDYPGTTGLGNTVPMLVNDLDLTVTAPDNSVHYPWTIDSPFSGDPGSVEPEPITAASIKPARRDQADHSNNVEQVYVEVPSPGIWTAVVKATTLPTPYQQKYSIVVGMPRTPGQDLTCGKVVFFSDRPSPNGPHQIYVKSVSGSAPPTQITQSVFRPHHPVWSPNGQFIAYIDKTLVVGPGSNQLDALFIVSATGGSPTFLPAGVDFGPSDALGYPDWSPDGKRIVLTTVPGGNWSARNLKTVEFATASNFNGGHTVSTLVASGSGAAEGKFSPDGKYVYYEADAGGPGALWRIPVAGGTASQVYANGTPIVSAYASSISPDGRRIIYNSELWKSDSITYLDEELLQADLLTGVGVALTHEPGNQYGRFAKGGQGEYVMQSNTSVNGKTDIFLATNNARVRLDVADPGNNFNDAEADWWKPGETDSVTARTHAQVCVADTYTDVNVTIHNAACVAHGYSYSVVGLPGVGGAPGSTFNVNGPTQFQFLDPNPVTVPAAASVTVKVRMFRPAGLTANGLVAGFLVTATNLDTNASLSGTGSLRDVRPNCPPVIRDE